MIVGDRSRMNNHCLQQQSVNSARTENILNLTIRTWWLRSRSVKTFSKSICLARQLKYYLPSLVTISISQILGDTWPAFTRVVPKRAQGKSLGTRLFCSLQFQPGPFSFTEVSLRASKDEQCYGCAFTNVLAAILWVDLWLSSSSNPSVSWESFL